ncbi:vacuolar protein sorting-associated protein 72 homolog [Actinia tenebrosa]|uniref:Vacuolar protein sorting-associated protein 72 homolog n=1 Tax=Actinia tenebrosa TaxID=6105 RepID=A0A6P8J2M2_ACTTE|nr:vacuolar protein sorting-associated protein 72 homolog [Actinia tenebrosa]
MADEGTSLVKSRPQRKNAGNRMSKMIEDEQEVDDFYKTAFGGFEEESGDEEFEKDEEEDVDIVDSDFSLSETDEVIEQDEDEPKRKRKKVFIKPYRQQKPESEEPKPKQAPKPKKFGGNATPREGLRKSTRTLTVSKAEELKQRQHEEKEKRSKQKQQNFKAPPGMRRLTQEELLAEAKITEEENLASLAAYQRLEADRKKTKVVKVTNKGPLIRFCSLSMPVVEIHEPILKVDEIEKDEEDPKVSVDSSKRCSRNFLIFTDAKSFPDAYFPTKKVKYPQRKYCPVTGLPAQYRDPLTGLPYANAQAFRYIRESYVMQMEENKEKGGMENETRKRR